MSTSTSWVERRSQARSHHRQNQLERQRLLANGLPAEHLDPRFTSFTPSAPARSTTAKRSMNCPMCDVRIERGDTVKAVALNVFAHWQCLAERKTRGPKAWNQAARTLSRLTELRRRVFWAVACPACGADVHQACRTEHGVRRHQNHRARMFAYSAAKRARQQVADAALLQEIRQSQGRTAPVWGRKVFLDVKAGIESGMWSVVDGVLVDHHGMPVVRT